MRKKIFIAVNIDEKSKHFITKKIEKWNAFLPIKWIDQDNFHLALISLGSVDINEISILAKKIEKALENQEVFDVMLEKFVLAPRLETPKMLWLQGEKQPTLIDLKAIIESALAEFEVEKKPFAPHINLGRFIQSEMNQFIIEKIKPLLEQRSKIPITVSSLDLMESISEKGETKYFIIQSIILK